MNIGAELKRSRVSQGMTLEELSNKCGYSKALISRVEAGLVAPSIKSLTKMASALGLQLYELFATLEAESSSVTHKSERRLFIDEQGVRMKILTPHISSKLMEPTQIDVPVGYESGQEPTVSRSEQFICVMEGKIEVTSRDNTYILNGGDSIYLRAGMPYKWRNIGKRTAIMLRIATPPTL